MPAIKKLINIIVEVIDSDSDKEAINKIEKLVKMLRLRRCKISQKTLDKIIDAKRVKVKKIKSNKSKKD